MNRDNGSGVFLMLAMLLGGMFYMQSPSLPAGGEAAKPSDKTDASMAAGPDEPDGGKCQRDAGFLLLDLIGEPDPGSTGSARVADIRQVAERNQLDVEFLVATVPDPLDAHVGWQFDGQLAAVQRAIEGARHFPDRYFFPWKCDPGKAKDAHGADHRRAPGVMIFRSQSHALVLFLVGETPTTGVHKIALTRAFEFIRDWQAGKSRPEQTIRIVGPSFSGSAGSVRTTIWQWWKAYCPNGPSDGLCNFRIISGSATGAWVPRVLTTSPSKGGCGGTIDFQATVIPDDARSAALFAFLERLNSGVTPAGTDAAGDGQARVAILTETGTAYGQIGGGRKGDATESCALAADIIKPTHRHPRPFRKPRPEPTVLRLPFPLHISRVRAAHERLGRNHQANTPQEVGGGQQPELELALTDDNNPIDVVPSMAPPLTAASEELALSQILSMIAVEGIRYVGIRATDSRDTLFLVRQLRKYSPDVQLFLFENDVLFTHPEYRIPFEGALVLSTYPLFPPNQRWSFPYADQGQRMQFSAERAQGIYNATIAQVGDLAMHRNEARPATPLEYGLPARKQVDKAVDGPSTAISPPVWISVTAGGGFWPLAYFKATRKPPGGNGNGGITTAGRVFEYLPRQTGSFRRAAKNAWRFSDALFLTAIVLSWVHLGFYLPSRLTRNPIPRTRRRGGRLHVVFRQSHCDRCRRGQRIWMLLSLASLCAVNAAFIAVYRLGVSSTGFSIRVALLIVGIVTLFLGLTTAVLSEHWLLWRDAVAPRRPGHGGACGHEPNPHTPRVQRLGWAALIVCTFATIIGVTGLLLVYLTGNFPNLFGARALSFNSGVSPLAVIVFLGMGIYLAGMAQLRRIGLVESGVWDTPFEDADDPLPSRSRSAVAALTTRVREAAHSPLRSRSWSSLVVLVVLLWLMPVFLVCSRMLPTFEGPWIDGLLQFVLVLYVGCILLALVQLAGLWSRLRELLRRLSAHPLLPAFGRLPSQSNAGGGRLWGTVAAAADYAVAADQWDLLATHLWQQKLKDELGKEDTVIADAARQLSPDPGSSDPPQSPAFHPNLDDPNTRGHDLAMCGRLVGRALNRVWRASPLATQTVVAHDPSEVRKAAGAVKDTMPLYTTWNVGTEFGMWLRLAEEHVALQMAFFINQQLVQIRSLLTYMTLAIILFMMALNAYPFQPRGLLNFYSMSVFVAALATSVIVVIQIDKDPVLSRIAGTDPNKLDRSIIWPLLTYAVLPFLGLLATQFPELSGLSSGTAKALQVFR